MVFALVGALALAAGAAYWLLANRARPRAAAPRQSKAAGAFGAVEIRTRGSACDAARALEAQRFLAKDAPALPLAGCSAAQCSCKFVKLADRRTEGRRLEHGATVAALFLAKNRRKKRDRRRSGHRGG